MCKDQNNCLSCKIFFVCFDFNLMAIAPDKAAYYVFAQFHGPENAIKFISVCTKTQLKSLILNSELFRSVCRYSISICYCRFSHHKLLLGTNLYTAWRQI